MTLVSVIGNFFSSVAPVFYDFFDEIDTHIIISDDSKRDSKRARMFKKGVADFCKHKKDLSQHFVRIDEDSDTAIRKVCDYVLKHASGNIYVNVTDGLATINTLMSLNLLNKGVKFISYDIFDNEYHIIDKSGIVKRKKANSMNIKEHFMLKGYKINDYENMDFAIINKKSILELFDRFFDEFNEFKKSLTENTLKLDKYPNVVRILRKLGFDMNFKNLKVNQKTITGSLFEMYVYLKVKELGFDDVMSGAVIEINGIKNEFDLLLMKDNHLHVVECKFKNINKKNLEMLLYKYALLKEILDYDSKAFIISNDEITEGYANRAKSYNLKLINSRSDITTEISEFLKVES